MSRLPATNRPPTKDMYWFAHGGIESSNEKCLNQRGSGDCEEDISDSSSPTSKSLQDRKILPDDQKSPISLNSVFDSGNSSGPSSLETNERHRNAEKRIAVEERRKQLQEAEQERNDAVMRKHMEREAALEARRNAQRSNISFAFGSSVPRNVETLQSGDSDKIGKHSNANGLLLKGNDDIMSRSMTAAVPAPRGRRKNDLMPTVPYDRTSTPKSTAASSTRKRSVSMTRLDQLAQPRRHYVEANKANSAANSTASSMLKDTIKSPTRPLSSASEQSGGSGHVKSSVTRRVRSSPPKPRPVSIAGTVPDKKYALEKVSPAKKTFLAPKKTLPETKKALPGTNKPSLAKSTEKPKPAEKLKLAEKSKPTPRSTSTPKSAQQPATKQPTVSKTSSPKLSSTKKGITNKKKADMVSTQSPVEVTANESLDSAKCSASPPTSPPPPDSAAAEAERNNAKRIISEEEAKAALAEKRRLAREQAEREAELERQRQEELRKQEEERLRLEEEEQRRMEEEQLRLLEEHRRLEEEKLKKAIEENERREEEERIKREEEQRLKIEQERKAQEEAEKQRIELEEKLRKEEEERAERKKRLEKIMSRTRGKTSGTSPSGSVSSNEQLDSSENQQENLSSGANSLDSNVGEVESGPVSLEGHAEKLDPTSEGTSVEANPTYEVTSDNESLNGMVMPKSETASQDNSLVIIPENSDLKNNSFVESDVSVGLLPENLTAEIQAENIMGDVSIVSEEIKETVSTTDKFENQYECTENHPEEINMSSQIIDELVQVETSESNEEAVTSEATPLLETTTFTAPKSEAAVVNEAEVILSFDEDVKKSMSVSSTDMNTLLPDVSPPPEQIAPEEVEIEHHSHLSISSDIKLPDPIYETSDDGSVSSEKHHQHEYGNFGLQYEEHHNESHPMQDEVFSEQEILYSEDRNSIEKKDENHSSHLMAAYENQFDVGGMHDSIYAYETSDTVLAGVVEQPRELGEENVCLSKSSTSSLPENVESIKSNADIFPDVDEDKENVGCTVVFSQTNPFADNVSNFKNEFDIDAFANKENIQFSSSNSENHEMYNSNVLPEELNLENNQIEFANNSNNTSQELNVLEQNYSNQSLSKSPTVPSESLDFNNVTIIKAEDSEDCIGIISSVEHDRISNNLVQSIQNEQLKSNFDYSSVTDSEESSLDSNLSQVMNAEVSEKNCVDLNNESKINSDYAENPFSETETAINGSSVSKSNGDYYSGREFLSNGHRIESSDPSLDQNGDYVQLDGKHISSVDHSKNNIFDNVDAVDFGKMSPDPFLLKGSSNQISGNPFLLQDDQKPVLMTPDFLTN